MSNRLPINAAPVTLGIMIPCYNEEPNIVATLNNVIAAMTRLGLDYQILIIDDHSTDRTVEVVHALVKENPAPPIACLSNRRNEGLGYNYFLGAALIDCEYYMMINGDNVEPIHDIVAIVSHIGEADMLIPHWKNPARRGWRRYWPSVTYTWLVNTLSKNHLRYYNGPVLHRRENVLAFYRAFATRGFGYQAEIICHALSHGATHLEIPIQGEICVTRKTHAFRLNNVVAVCRTLISVANPTLFPAAPFDLQPDQFIVHDLKEVASD